MIPGNATIPLVAGIVLIVVSLAWIAWESRGEEDEEDCFLGRCVPWALRAPLLRYAPPPFILCGS